MKKFFGFIFALLLTMAISSCINCSNIKVQDQNNPQIELQDTVAIDTTIDVEHTIALDR